MCICEMLIGFLCHITLIIYLLILSLQLSD